MARPRRLAVKLNRDHAFEATRVVVKQKKLVDILATDDRLRCPRGWSKDTFGMDVIAVRLAAHSLDRD